MNFLRTVIGLCSSFKSYRLIRDLPLTSSMKYLLRLLTLLALILVASFVPLTIEGINEFGRRFDKDRPEFSIRDSKIVTSVPQPYRWGDDDLLFVLDTTGKVVKPDTTALRGILFMADSYTFWMQVTNAPEAGILVQTQKFLGYPNGVVNGAYFRKLTQQFVWIAVPLAWVLFVLVGMLMCSIQAYLFTAVASFMERTMPAPLRFQQLLNIALHAVTPAAIIFTAYMAMRLQELNLWLIYLVAYGVFLIGATNACRDKTAREEPRKDELL
jgi:hypothetical protein